MTKLCSSLADEALLHFEGDRNKITEKSMHEVAPKVIANIIKEDMKEVRNSNERLAHAFLNSRAEGDESFSGIISSISKTKGFTDGLNNC
jgi:hypothetical protein